MDSRRWDTLVPLARGLDLARTSLGIYNQVRVSDFEIFTSNPSRTRVSHLLEAELLRDYFPMQNVLKISPRISSMSVLPMISPMESRDERRSMAANSGDSVAAILVRALVRSFLALSRQC